MEKLLQWSIAQQTGDKDAQAKVGQPDPKMLEQLFGGPDEPTLMKQAMMVVENPDATDENKIIALDNFDMLIENLDNANNIENMKLWPAIVAQLSSPNEEIQVLALSIIATATQNNPKSQEAFIKQDNGLSKLISLASSGSQPVKLKALFALASLIRNCEDAILKFILLGGWECFALEESLASPKDLGRQLSLASALISLGVDESLRSSLQDSHLVVSVAKALDSEYPFGCTEKALNFISQLQQLDYPFNAAEAEHVRSGLAKLASSKADYPEEDWTAAGKV